MVNIDPNKEEDYIHDPHDYMEDVPQNWWIGCIAIIFFILIIIGVLFLITKCG